VLLLFFAACPTATSPTRISLSENATIDGVEWFPCAFAITSAFSPFTTATEENCVPKSMPMHGA
jgi:hypothetical protein